MRLVFMAVLLTAIVEVTSAGGQTASAQQGSQRKGDTKPEQSASAESCQSAYGDYQAASLRSEARGAADWYLTSARLIVASCSALDLSSSRFPNWLPRLVAEASLALGDTIDAMQRLTHAISRPAPTVGDSVEKQIAAYALGNLLYNRGATDSASVLWWRFGSYMVYPPSLAAVRRFNVHIDRPRTSNKAPRQSLASFDGEPITRAIQRLARAAGSLQSLLPPSSPFDVVLRSCESETYAYDPNERVIRLCYGFEELAASVARWDAAKALKVGIERGSIEEIERDVEGFLLFAILHEVGHAVVHQRRVPALGNQEDVADGFAAFAVMRQESASTGYDDVEAASSWLLSLEAWELDHKGDGLRDYAAVHPFPGQRSARLRCLIIGALLGAETAKAEERRCKQEWVRLKTSWTELLRTR